MKQNVNIILASNSPRRKELLEQVGLTFSVVTADIDESTGETSPDLYVQSLAMQKARAVFGMQKSRILHEKEDILIIGSDTVVTLENQILGKPKNEKDAVNMLLSLAGRAHEVYTGVCLVTKGSVETFCQKTVVHMRSFTKAEAEAYVKTGEPMDKAGAYGIQGIGAVLVEKIDGDYNTVVGFPLSEFVRTCMNRKWISL